MKSLVVLGCAAVAVLAASSAFGDGGPVPGVVAGEPGTMNAKGSIRYTALPRGRNTTVTAIRMRGGKVMRVRELRGRYGVARVAFDGTTGGVSADGRTLVLTSIATSPVTRFAVLRLPSLGRSQTVVLRGWWAFDAISPEAKTMYLIQLGPNGLTYNVRAYDLAHGRLYSQPVVDKREAGDPMRGVPVARVTGDRGRWAYTLYANGEKPFVHALDTVARRAVCVDLPHAGDRLALHGTRLIVLNQSRRVAVVDTRTLQVLGSST
jgi:hypothetical protein